MSTNEFSYIIRPRQVVKGQVVHSYRDGIPEPLRDQRALTRVPGNCMRLADIPIGTLIHNITLTPDGPAQLYVPLTHLLLAQFTSSLHLLH